MPKKTPLQEVCPLDTAVQALGGKWKPLIVYQLRRGTKRFSELQRAIPEVTRQMLTQLLRQLEGGGIVRRTGHPVVPPRVDYALTEMGKELTSPPRPLRGTPDDGKLELLCNTGAG